VDGGVWGLRMVGGAVKEGEGGYVAVDGKDFGEEIGGVDQAGEEDKAERVLVSVGSPSLSTSRDACLSTWTSSGEPRKSQDR
jgi:hypothetical protein